MSSQKIGKKGLLEGHLFVFYPLRFRFINLHIYRSFRFDGDDYAVDFEGYAIGTSSPVTPLFKFFVELPLAITD
jgi:hypothetical protein